MFLAILSQSYKEEKLADAQTPETRKNWISVLNKIISLNPTIFIPAHAKEDAAFNLDSVKHTNDYILFYEEALKRNKTSEALINTIKSKYPSLTFDIALQIGAKVNTGEMKW